MSTELVGGLPADEKAIRIFCEHHLKITDPQERENAVRRIMKEELGEREVTPEMGEVKEKQVYGVNILRRSEKGPWLGNWMVKANLKQAASRVGVFSSIRGTKGGMSEAGRVVAEGISLLEPENQERIYVRNAQGDGPANTYFKEFMGRVQTPQGAVSIIHHSECVAPGSRFTFRYNFMSEKMKESDVVDLVAMSMIMGLGSVRSLECGKFRIERAIVQLVKKTARGKEEVVEEKEVPVESEKANGLAQAANA